MLLVGCVETKNDTKTPSAVEGALDLTAYDFNATDVVNLNGEWEFYWDTLFTTLGGKNLPQPDIHVEFPKMWNNLEIDNKKLGSFGCATYRLNVRIPKQLQGEILSVSSLPQSTAYAICVDGKTIAKAGKTGTNKLNSTSLPIPVSGSFVTTSDSIEFIIKVSNYKHRMGGIRHPIQLGSMQAITREIHSRRRNSWLLIGVIFIVIIYHLALYLYRKKAKMPLYFSFFSLVLFIRAGFTGEMVFVQELISVPYKVILSLGHLTYFLSVPLALHYLHYLFEGQFSFKYVKVSYYIVIPFVLITLLFPEEIASKSIPYFHAFYLFGSFYILIKLILLTVKRVSHANLVLLGVIIMIATAINDLLFVNQVIYSVAMVHYGLISLILSQAIVISMKFSKAFADNETLLTASAKFVPSEFLQKLNKTSLRELQLGDQVETEMTVMFIDIRSFTTLSESMKPEENFEFINAYLARMGPLIRESGGFIDKYIGDAIMALFDTPEHAAEASINIAKELRIYNRLRQKHGELPIHIGIGIHTGNLMMGIIGEDERLEGTVISDAVNLASRLEGVTKNYKSTAIFSHNTLKKMNKLPSYNYRLLDMVQVKGKSERITIYELLDCLPEKDRKKRIASTPRFQTAVELFWDEDYVSANELFSEIAEENPYDIAAKQYAEQCEQYKRFGTGIRRFIKEAK